MSSLKLSLGAKSLLACRRGSCQHHEVSMELAVAWTWQSVKPPERAQACPADHELASLPWSSVVSLAWRIVFLLGQEALTSRSHLLG